MRLTPSPGLYLFFPSGNTALHFLLDPMMKHHADPEQKMATFLLSRGADPTRRNKYGQTPAEGVAPAAGAAPERAFSGAASLTRPFDEFAEAIAHAAHEESAARSLLAKGAPQIVRRGKSPRRTGGSGGGADGMRARTPTTPGSSLANARLAARAASSVR
jgi:hypothetical protein